MKFRGLISEYTTMKEFMNIINCLAKLSKECAIRILHDKLYFIVTEEDNGPKRPFVWCELITGFYFKEYQMEGISSDCPEIFLSFSTGMLAKSVNSVKMGAKSLKIKLTNKQTPCLTLEIEMAMESFQSRLCVHDIPVNVISKKYWNEYTEPKFQEFHVTLQMPAMKSIRNIVDRMKSMSNYLIISANKNGKVTLKIESTSVTLSAHFPNLTVHSFADGLSYDNDSEMTCVDSEGGKSKLVLVSIDIKKFLAFLTAMHITNNKMICSIVHGKMLKLVLNNPGIMNLQCFLTERSL